MARMNESGTEDVSLLVERADVASTQLLDVSTTPRAASRGGVAATAGADDPSWLHRGDAWVRLRELYLEEDAVKAAKEAKGAVVTTPRLVT